MSLMLSRYMVYIVPILPSLVIKGWVPFSRMARKWEFIGSIFIWKIENEFYLKKGNRKDSNNDGLTQSHCQTHHTLSLCWPLLVLLHIHGNVVIVMMCKVCSAGRHQTFWDFHSAQRQCHNTRAITIFARILPWGSYIIIAIFSPQTRFLG